MASVSTEKDVQRRVELAIELVDELIEIGVSADTYLFNTSYCSEEFVTHLETYGKEWVSAVKSNARVSYGGDRIRVDALCKRIDTVPRTINDETYHIWTQKRDVSRLGKVKLLITEKESRKEDDEASMKYIVSNKIDAPASHLIELYAMRWRVETFFRDTKQDLSLGDCEFRYAAGASRNWHLLMLAYSLLKLVLQTALLERFSHARVHFATTSSAPSVKAFKTFSLGHSIVPTAAPTS